MPEWPTRTLHEVCSELTVGHVGSMATEYTAEGVTFLRSQNVRAGSLDLKNVKYISAEFHQRLKKSRLSPGDIVIVRTGEPGAAALIPETFDDLNCSDLVIARPSEEISAPYLCYAINATAGQYIAAHLVGAVQQHFNVAAARNLLLSIPPISVQRSIAALLGALDDKIAVDECVARTCDELRTLKLKHWVQANPAMVQEFPLSSIAAFINGRAFTKDATGSGRMVIRISEISSGPGASTVYNDIAVPDIHLARPGDVLFSWSGSLAVARWYRPEAIINQHIFKVVPRDGLPAWLAFELVQAELAAFKVIAAGKATTMGHIQRHHLDAPVAVPVESCLAVLDAELGPLWQRALAAEQESLKLIELRDTLLPKLMSGEVRVRDAEKVVGEVT
jgi:type I restriction enzyme S subunit